ncbi:MAG: hypothetical protein K6E98_05855 [Lachnospiraceae bacterium]|nr:hypothetical protein [Lachnospiraceae bacterium]
MGIQNKKVLVIYDDSRKPSVKISAITGRKSYGNIIFKRQPLKVRTGIGYMKLDFVKAFVDSKDKEEISGYAADNVSVFKIYSDHESVDYEAIKVLLEKSLYIKENYIVKVKENTAAVMYPSVKDYIEADNEAKEEDFEVIETDALISIADASNFRTFITSGFDARFFNTLKGDDYTVVKSSDNIEKLRKEYKYFTLLPADMKPWFGTVYDYKEENGKAYYSIERYHMTDLAIRYVHGAIDEAEFKDICRILFHFIECRKIKEVSDEEYEADSKALYLDKVDQRIELLKSLSGYEKIKAYISTGTDYGDIDEIVARYKRIYNDIVQGRRFKKVLVVGHGDLCFSNILYNNDVSLLRLIDPKGASCEEELYMNPYYDIAKLSHSICGGYDYFNSDQYEITVDPKMRLKLILDCDNDKFINIFYDYLEQSNIDRRLIRVYEASLFLSMLPLHIDREKKVMGFILNAIRILDELEE